MASFGTTNCIVPFTEVVVVPLATALGPSKACRLSFGSKPETCFLRGQPHLRSTVETMVALIQVFCDLGQFHH